MFSLTVPISSEGGHTSFQNNLPDPVTSGKELPTFKFELEKSEGRVMGGSYGKEATVEQLPISKGIAGVSMRMEPGVMRELHWHATAAEWAFVTEGRVRTTVIDPQGCCETNDFGPGDVWYFPRGHGHVIETLGDKPCHFILVFDNGYFSEFGTFSITDWLGHAPKELLAKNFGVPASTFDSFPKNEVYFAKGKIPPAGRRSAAAGLEDTAAHAQVQPAFPEALRSLQRWAGVAGGWLAISYFHDHDRRGAGDGAGRASRIALASQCRRVAIHSERRIQRDPVRLARDAGAKSSFSQGMLATSRKALVTPLKMSASDKARILIVFNNGHYQTIDLSQWIAGNPTDILATNFAQDASVFEKFPRKDVFLDQVGRVENHIDDWQC